jgi:hypothetical protein
VRACVRARLFLLYGFYFDGFDNRYVRSVLYPIIAEQHQHSENFLVAFHKCNLSDLAWRLNVSWHMIIHYPLFCYVSFMPKFCSRLPSKTYLQVLIIQCSVCTWPIRSDHHYCNTLHFTISLNRLISSSATAFIENLVFVYYWNVTLWLFYEGCCCGDIFILHEVNIRKIFLYICCSAFILMNYCLKMRLKLSRNYHWRVLKILDTNQGQNLQTIDNKSFG